MTIKLFLPELLILSLTLTTGCGSSVTTDSEERADAKTPVTITHISMEPMAETIDLNAVSSFLKKSSIKSTATGIIESVEVNLGENVKKGDLLFSIKTKEAVALEKASTKDTSFNFKGLIRIKSGKDGVVSSITHHKGDYVQEADELAVLAEQSSLVFLLEVPYELHKFVRTGETCDIVFADKQQMKGTLSSGLPIMDIQSQTENYIVKPVSNGNLPENLIVKVQLIKNSKPNATVLPKAAVLANETQTDFWIMKLLNDSVAIKVPVTKGIENADKVEILEPMLKTPDKILLTGNYGLSDTAKVSILKEK
jgi:Membrane-fusion protein